MDSYLIGGDYIVNDPERGSKVIAKKAKQPEIKRPPARTPQEREDQLIWRAYDLAEKQIIEGSASSQTINHFLKMGSDKERLERSILAEQEKLIKAKTDAIKAAQRVEELYEEAIKAMRIYGGDEDE